MPALPSTVALYIAELAGFFKTTTIERRLVTITRAHRDAGNPSPVKTAQVQTTWQGIKRAHGMAQEAKTPILIEDLRKMIETLPKNLIGLRDRTILLIGFAGAFRRAELVGLNVEDLDFQNDGLVITLKRSKTDQEGNGRKVGIPYGSNPMKCPVRALQEYLEITGIETGAIFRPITRGGQLQDQRSNSSVVSRVVKRAAERVGLDSAKFAGHSLRSGLATSAARAGVSELSIMNQTGQKSLLMLRRYVHEGSLFHNNAAASVGL